MQTRVDLLVLGGGPGGYVAAIRAAQLGRQVAVVEGRWWGGVCLNVGCVPTKALLRNAEVADLVTRQAGTFGITGDIHVDYGTGWRRSRQVVASVTKGVQYLLQKNNVMALDGWGTFTDPHTIMVQVNDGTVVELQFDQAIIATGAVARTLPGVTVGGRVMTYEQLLMQEELPKSLVVAGSGAVGVELASIFASFGSKVTIVESLNRLVPAEDEVVSKELARAFRRRGIAVLTATDVQGVDQTGDSVLVRTVPASGGVGAVIEADALLLALGFTPKTTGFGLTETGVALDDRGFIEVDDMMRTNVPHICAIGDVTGKLMLAHVASAQGIIAAETLSGLAPAPLDYQLMPRATYCEPQIASIGLTVAQAQASGHEITVSRFPLSANAKAQALAQASGFVMLVADTEHNELVGAHLIGPGVTELLPELTLAATWDLTTDEIARTVHAHPTISEAIAQAAQGIAGWTIDL